MQHYMTHCIKVLLAVITLIGMYRYTRQRKGKAKKQE